MAQLAKIEAQWEIKSSAEKFFETFCSKAYLLPKICPSNLKDLQLVKGDWGCLGSVKEWTLVAGDRSVVFKEIVEAKDEENNSITSKVLDGDMTKEYNTYIFTVQATTRGEGCSSVKCIIEYEKANENVPPPNKYIEFGGPITKSIDAYLANN